MSLSFPILTRRRFFINWTERARNGEKLVSVKMWGGKCFRWKSCSFHEKWNFDFNTVKDILSLDSLRNAILSCSDLVVFHFSRFSVTLRVCFSSVIFHMKMKIEISKYTRKVMMSEICDVLRNLQSEEEKKKYIFVDISLNIILKLFTSFQVLSSPSKRDLWSADDVRNDGWIIMGSLADVCGGESLDKVTNQDFC